MHPPLYTLCMALVVADAEVDARADAVGVRDAAWSGDSGLLRERCERGVYSLVLTRQS